LIYEKGSVDVESIVDIDSFEPVYEKSSRENKPQKEPSGKEKLLSTAEKSKILTSKNLNIAKKIFLKDKSVEEIVDAIVEAIKRNSINEKEIDTSLEYLGKYLDIELIKTYKSILKK
jgi:hypothetical protein